MKTNDMKKETIFGLGIVSFGIKLCGAASSFLLSIIIARNFYAEGTGLYSLANSILNIFVILSVFGFENSIIKFVSIYYEQKGYDAIKKIKKNSLIISLILSCLSLGIILLLAQKISINIFQKPYLTKMLKIIILSVFPICGIRIYSSLLKGVGRIKEGLMLETVLPALLNICFLVFYCTMQKQSREILFTASSFFIANTIACIYGALLWNRFSRKLKNGKYIDFNNQVFLKTSFNLLLVSATNYILTTTDTLMLGLWSSEREIGIYNIAMKVTTISSMFLIAINAVIGPYCATLYAKDKMQEIKKVVNNCIKIMFVCATFFLLICVLFRKMILGYFGVEFLKGENILIIAAIGQFVVLATGPVATVLMMIGHEKMHRNNTIVCALMNILLNIILIPKLGILGASIATTISLIIKNIVAICFLKLALNK